MELYHWYKGTTCPTGESLCIVIWGHYGSTYCALCRIVKSQYYQSYDFYKESGGLCIELEQIIRWMPIKFPKRVEIE